MQWGTLGEWASSLAVIVGVVALLFEIRERQDEKERRREEAARAAWEDERRVARRISIWPDQRMKDNSGIWFQRVCFSNTSDETVRSFTVFVEFPALHGEPEVLHTTFSGPLRPTELDSVNVFFDHLWVDHHIDHNIDAASVEYEESEETTDLELRKAVDHWAETELGEAVVSARFEDHEGRLWKKFGTGHLERLDSPDI